MSRVEFPGLRRVPGRDSSRPLREDGGGRWSVEPTIRGRSRSRPRCARVISCKDAIFASAFRST